ncbi:hypothetical protein [Arsukibacterium perlucidum]|uniref:hypothetical protein n=1 Tax=Arsukibacterium perlucidum TaxID=368811 RepID=UPI0012F97985|nr:hypothetical protein [Arsukibacterium perlucidum]
MDKYKYAVSLRIEHPSIAKEEIVKNLGLSPEFNYSAGETRKTPSGKPLEGLYKITYCCFDTEFFKVVVRFSRFMLLPESARFPDLDSDLLAL